MIGLAELAVLGLGLVAGGVLLVVLSAVVPAAPTRRGGTVRSVPVGCSIGRRRGR